MQPDNLSYEHESDVPQSPVFGRKKEVFARALFLGCTVKLSETHGKHMQSVLPEIECHTVYYVKFTTIYIHPNYHGFVLYSRTESLSREICCDIGR